MSAIQELVNRLAGEDKELLVISFDIGTTQSGAAFSYIASDGNNCRAPCVIENLAGQTPGRAKIPSVLFYDKSGKCSETWGTQSNNLSREEIKALQDGTLHKSEWFKLYIDPENKDGSEAFATSASRKLPPGKGAIEIYGDLLPKISIAAKESVKNEFGITWLRELELKGKVRYIVSIPVAWHQDPVTMAGLRQQASRIGLVNDDTASSLSFCSESEASALYCYDQMKHLECKVGEVFLVVDAGGGTDFTAYKIASVKPLELEEQSLQSKICLYAGSTYVDDTFATLLEPYLATREKAGGFWIVDSEESSFDGGGIEIPWTLIESAFKPHVKRIVEMSAALTQLVKPKYIFCSGGFGGNAYLRQQLEAGTGDIQVIQPDTTASSYGSKAVTLGACLFGLRTWIKKRVMPKCIGCPTSFRLNKWDKLDSEDKKRVFKEHGWSYLGNRFTVIVDRNQAIDVKDYYSHHLYETYRHPMKGPVQRCTFDVLESTAPIAPRWDDDPSAKVLGSFEYFIPKGSETRVEKAPDGSRVGVYEFVIRIYCGEGELRASVHGNNGEVYGHSSFLQKPTSVVKVATSKLA